jgi:hypothetical protein
MRSLITSGLSFTAAIRALEFTLGAVIISTAANAALTIDVNQQGSDVVVSVGGTLSLDGLTFAGPTVSDNQISPAIGFLATGTPDGSALSAYSGFSGPGQFGSGGFTDASSGTGDVFALNAGPGFVLVPSGFITGSAIDSGATFSNATFASLGLTAGQYVYTSRGNTITLNIGPASVPEPASWAMMLIGFGGMGFTLRRATIQQVTPKRFIRRGLGKASAARPAVSG